MEIIKQGCIWLTRDLEVLTTLTLCQNSLTYIQPTKTTTLLTSDIIGCKISHSSCRSFNLMYFSRTSFKFKTPEFTCTSYQQAQSWCEIIENTLYSGQSRHICFIINPLSGSASGQKVFDKDLIPVLNYSPASYDCFLSTHAAFIDELIHRRDFSVYTDLVCLGGDGTIQQAINAINQTYPHLLSSMRFGVVPVGSRNALSCELSGKSISSSIFNIVKGNYIQGDLMKININNQSILATCAVSWGLISEASDEAQHLRIFGPMRYNLVAFKKFFTKWKEYSGIISFEDTLGQMISFTSKYLVAVVSNHRIPNMHNSEIVMPNARINNGKLDLMMVFFTSKCKTLNMFMKMQKSGGHVGFPSVNFVKTNRVKIEPGDLRVFNVDGEIHYANMIEIEVLPKAINYIADPEYH